MKRACGRLWLWLHGAPRLGRAAEPTQHGQEHSLTCTAVYYQPVRHAHTDPVPAAMYVATC